MLPHLVLSLQLLVDVGKEQPGLESRCLRLITNHSLGAVTHDTILLGPRAQDDLRVSPKLTKQSARERSSRNGIVKTCR
jgi:hypothetical protein